MGELPKNWVGCPAMANGLVGDIFFTFKTPLSPQLNRKLEAERQFCPENVIQGIRHNFNKEIGLWIDLTNTNRYYRKDVVESHGIEYVKMAIEGHGSFPSNHQRLKFAKICDDFLRRCPGGVIGVHCTHGYNRTGFLITFYLMFRRKYNVHQALEEFSNIRPPGIYRHNYVDELYDIFINNIRQNGANEGFNMPPPNTHYVQNPSWKPEHREDRGFRRNHYGNANGCQQSGSNYQDYNNHHFPNNNVANANGLHRPFEPKRYRFDEDEPIDELNLNQNGQFSTPNFLHPEEPGQLVSGNVFFQKALARSITPYSFGLSNRNSLLRILRHMCHLDDSGPLFPELMELGQENIERLSMEMGTVTWQSTGKMFLCFIQNKKAIFLIGEDESVWCVSGMNFPSKRNPLISTSDTVLIGEMTNIKADGKDLPAFIISDILCLGGKYVGKLSLLTRRRCLKEEIIQARGEAITRRLFSSSEEPFAIRNKPYFTLGDATTLLNPAFQFRLSEPPAYLLFLHSTDPFKVGPVQNGFRWKFPLQKARNVDFLLRIQQDDRLQGDLIVNESNEPFSVIPIPEEMAILDGKVIECKFESGKWIFVLEKPEVTIPHSLSIAMEVQNGGSSSSENNDVSKQKLLDVISALTSTTVQ